MSELLLGPDGAPMLNITEVVDLPPPTPEGVEPDWTRTAFPIELFNDKLAIRRDDREQFTDKGLVLPPSAQSRSMTGVVVAAGPGFLKGDGSRLPMPVAVGDRVVFEQMRQMTPVIVQGYTYHILNAHDLLGRAAGEVRIRGQIGK
jgi:chaperonin GroES